MYTNNQETEKNKKDNVQIIVTFIITFVIVYMLYSLIYDNNDYNQVLSNIKGGEPPF